MCRRLRCGHLQCQAPISQILIDTLNAVRLLFLIYNQALSAAVLKNAMLNAMLPKPTAELRKIIFEWQFQGQEFTRVVHLRRARDLTSTSCPIRSARWVLLKYVLLR